MYSKNSADVFMTKIHTTNNATAKYCDNLISFYMTLKLQQQLPVNVLQKGCPDKISKTHWKHKCHSFLSNKEAGHRAEVFFRKRTRYTWVFSYLLNLTQQNRYLWMWIKILNNYQSLECFYYSKNVSNIITNYLSVAQAVMVNYSLKDCWKFMKIQRFLSFFFLLSSLHRDKKVNIWLIFAGIASCFSNVLNFWGITF